MRNVKVPGSYCLSINESDKICFILADDSNSSLTLIYASKTKSALPKSNANKNQITTSNNSPPTSSRTNKNNIKQLTSDLGAFFQSDNPTDLRHNETLAPELCLAGDDVAMTPEELWSHGARDRKEPMTKRKRWKHFTGFLELLGWVASSHVSLQPILDSIYYISNLSFTDLAQGFDCHAWNLNGSEFLPTERFSLWRRCQSHHKYTNTQGTKKTRHTVSLR